MYGTAGERYGRAFSFASPYEPERASQQAYVPSEDTISRIKRDETMEALQVKCQHFVLQAVMER